MPTEPNDEDRERARESLEAGDAVTLEAWADARRFIGSRKGISGVRLTELLLKWRESGIDALRLALAACEAMNAQLREWVQHDERCVLMRYSAGRPTESGGYEMEYRGVWYEVRPVDRRPQCECGLTAALSAPRDSEALAAFGEKVALAVMADARIDYRGDDEDAPVCVATAIVARVLSGGASE